MIVPPGGGPPPHSHPDTQEMFYVLEGEVEFKTETGKQIVGKDGFVNIPFGGTVHCFKNNSQEFVRLLCTVVPAGLEKLFEEIGAHVEAGQMLPVPELTEKRKEFLKEMDIKYNQKTYPPNFLD
ncbi:Cupin domain protein [compost metagenome]